jgi:hypothetical protein
MGPVWRIGRAVGAVRAHVGLRVRLQAESLRYSWLGRLSEGCGVDTVWGRVGWGNLLSGCGLAAEIFEGLRSGAGCPDSPDENGDLRLRRIPRGREGGRGCVWRAVVS